MHRQAATCVIITALAAATVGIVGGNAHAQDREIIPTWVRSIFEFYGGGQIDDRELIGALEYLIAEGIIQIKAAPAEPNMSAEALSYNLDADAWEQASIESRRDMIEALPVLDAAAEHIRPNNRQTWAQHVESLRQLAATMDATDAAVITSMRAAAADGTVSAAERADVKAARAAANAVSEAANAALTRILPDHSALAYGPQMVALASGMSGGGAWQHYSDDAIIAPYKPDTPALDISPVDIRGTIHADTNAARAQHGLPDMHRDPDLDALAQAHAEDMAARDYYSHDTPEGIGPSGRAALAGYDCRKDYGAYYTTGIGENIAWWSGYSAGSVASNAVTNWMNSPGHRENILGTDYSRLGVGAAASRSGGTIYAVQNFC